MRPAEEVGGDYYDVVPCDGGGAWLGIGDVSGHGLNAGLVMLMVQSAAQALIRAVPDIEPADLFRKLNQVLHDNVRMRLERDDHVTPARAHDDVAPAGADDRRDEAVAGGRRADGRRRCGEGGDRAGHGQGEERREVAPSP